MTVIDCSAMIELLAAKTQTGDAIARRVTTVQTLYAPYVLDGEVISALLGLRRGQKISEREADAALSNYRAFPVDRQDGTMRGRRLRHWHLTGRSLRAGVRGRWGGWGSNPRPADYENYGPALPTLYLHGYHGAVPPMALIALYARMARSTPDHNDRRMPATERYRRRGLICHDVTPRRRPTIKVEAKAQLPLNWERRSDTRRFYRMACVFG